MDLAPNYGAVLASYASSLECTVPDHNGLDLDLDLYRPRVPVKLERLTLKDPTRPASHRSVPRFPTKPLPEIFDEVAMYKKVAETMTQDAGK